MTPHSEVGSETCDRARRVPETAVLAADDPLSSSALVARAAALGIPIRTRSNLSSGTTLVVQTGGSLELRRAEELDRPGVRAALEEAHSARRRLRRGEPLRRALGTGHGPIWDATAGLGGDSWLLASCGRPVLAIERSPLLILLLEDALAKLLSAHSVTQGAHAPDPRVCPRAWRVPVLELAQGDACELLPRLLRAGRPIPDVIYLDPMFPQRRKRSPLPRKAAQLLRELSGPPEDAQRLLAVARTCCRDRVVVKRALEAEPVTEAPRASHCGKLVRYDVYAGAAAH